MSGGGSGGSGTQKYEWNDGTNPYWTQVLGMGNYLTGLGLPGPDGKPTEGKPYERYGGQRIANLTEDHGNAMGRIREMADSGGAYDTNMARDQAYSTLRGDYLEKNPYAGAENRFAGQGNAWRDIASMPAKNSMVDTPYQNENTGLGASANPYADRQVNPGINKYAGDNPYFRSTMQTGLQEIGDQYKNTTEANTNKMMNLAGIFGGGAHQRATANNEAGLGKTLSNYTDSMLNRQYDRSASLEEADLGRYLDAQKFNQGQGASLYENALNRGFQSGEADISRRFGGMESRVGRDLQNQQWNKEIGSGIDEARLNRQFGGEESRLGRGSGAYEGERGRMMGAMGAGLQGNDITMRLNQGLMGVGDITRAYRQDHLNQNYTDWQEQQNHPLKMLDTMTGLLARSQGGMSGNLSATQPGYAASPYAGLLGGALAAYGLSR